MKVVINHCYGGFGLSPKALKAWAKLKGRECHFYEGGLSKPYTPVAEGKEEDALLNIAFDVRLPFKAVKQGRNDEFNKWYSEHSISSHDIERNDPDLIRVIEELGQDEASNRFSNLVIVEIPDGIEYTIQEYDGYEHIAEKHRTWG